MIAPDLIGKALRLQRTLGFKIAASIVVVLLAAGALATYVVQQNRLDHDKVEVRQAPEEAQPGAAPESDEEKAAKELARAGSEADARYINEILSAQAGWTGVAVLLLEITILVLALIWLGLGLSGLGLVGLIALVAWRLKLFQGGLVQLEELKRYDIAFLFLGGAAVITVAFIVMMELLKLAFSASHPITAVARNVVNEAVRLKVSLVFIVLLIFGLAALPGLLDASTPLRYRVQAFLSYSTGGTFWLIALLTVFLSVGSVAFEQRDRIIWQTMTKPVGAWQYVLGKWLGVVGVAAVLLAVSGSGIFVFTDFLSRQRAVGESQPFVARDGLLVSEDRDILQAQVLSARRIVKPQPPEFNEQFVEDKLKEKVEELNRVSPLEIPDLEKIRADIINEVREEIRTGYFALDPMQSEVYVFYGLDEAKKTTWMSPERYAKKTGRTLEDVRKAMAENRVQTRVGVTGDEVRFVDVRSVSMRYKVQAGGNDPRATARVSFELVNQPQVDVRVVPLNTTMSMRIPPSAIDDEGRLYVRITNGDLVSRIRNEMPFVFPPDGLEVRFEVGTYQMNFARVVLVLWLKIAFLAMAAIAAATFLSFPVAAMMAFGILFVAETAGFLTQSLESYDAGEGGKINLFRLAVKAVAVPIAAVFKYYADINPVENLADGKLVPWTTVAWASIIMTGACAVLYGIGVGVFRKRELATYSGQ